MAAMITNTSRNKTGMAPLSLEGQSLGKYRILEPLGRGGMAQVYKAYHPQLDRYVAVKILRSDLVEEEEFLARFRREARAIAALRHPNIVQIFDFDVQNDLYYMVMELLEGDTL
jgi:serine/threonine protein kinase